jgi:membrane protein insertase Oxa1/YidC/SpoIIIJ
MKTIYIVIMFVAAFVAFYQQSLPKPNMVIMAIAIIVFMVLLMRLMSRVPNKKNDDGNDV